MPSEYANDLMARVGLDTTECKKGITYLNAGIKQIETGFQATAALMDDWSNSSDGLKLRVDSLNDTYLNKLPISKIKIISNIVRQVSQCYFACRQSDIETLQFQ